jgi:hypothetical protein
MAVLALAELASVACLLRWLGPLQPVTLGHFDLGTKGFAQYFISRNYRKSCKLVKFITNYLVIRKI